jgi:voltage-dependent calcium channel
MGSTANPPPTAPPRLSGNHDDDPFLTPSNKGFFEVSTAVPSFYYSSAEAGPSRASLMHDHGEEDYEGHREDDEAHLTANMSRNGSGSPSHPHSSSSSSDDPEHTGASSMMSPRSKRKSTPKKYSVAPSPMKTGESAMKSMSRGLRRMSLRVVNLAGTGMADQLRLKDVDEPVSARSKKLDEDDEDDEPPITDLKESLPIRGRTLCFLGPTSKVRQLLYRFLVYHWTEPAILVLIILNAVVLTFQAASPRTLPTANGPTLPPKIKGYFHTWEDYVLFALFIVFTYVARLSVPCATDVSLAALKPWLEWP